MSSNHSGRRNAKTKTSSSNAGILEHKKILILVKAAPLPSTKYLETICTAGIDEDGKWYRLYPIPFRFLNQQSKYKKYQWIQVDINKVVEKADNRVESYRPNIKSIKTVGVPLSSKNQWEARRRVVLPIVNKSIEQLQDRFFEKNISLGVIKPKKIINFTAEKDTSSWQGRKAFAQNQLKLFGPQPKNLKKVPYKFYYHFFCNDSGCKEPHKFSIHDWEINMLYHNMKRKYGYAEDIVLEKVKQKWFDQMCAKDKDTYLFVGTVHSRFKRPIFVVLGVFWPPKIERSQVRLSL